jgi:hypothetical protein
MRRTLLNPGFDMIVFSFWAIEILTRGHFEHWELAILWTGLIQRAKALRMRTVRTTPGASRPILLV